MAASASVARVLQQAPRRLCQCHVPVSEGSVTVSSRRLAASLGHGQAARLSCVTCHDAPGGQRVIFRLAARPVSRQYWQSSSGTLFLSLAPSRATVLVASVSLRAGHASSWPPGQSVTCSLAACQALPHRCRNRAGSQFYLKGAGLP